MNNNNIYNLKLAAIHLVNIALENYHHSTTETRNNLRSALEKYNQVAIIKLTMHQVLAMDIKQLNELSLIIQDNQDSNQIIQ